MAENVITTEEVIIAAPPDISQIITEDDTPVDNLFSAKQQRLLVETLYTSWRPERDFVADANVGIFRTPHLPAIVPDVFLSLDVQIAEDWYAKQHRTYFVWEFGKPPDGVIEIVSNTKGGELGRKLEEYARLGVLYYAVYDPQQLIQDDPLVVYELHVGRYIPNEDTFLNEIGLGLTLWEGIYETKEDQWLRWTDLNGKLLPTGLENTERERQRADRLAEQLRALGVDPAA